MTGDDKIILEIIGKSREKQLISPNDFNLRLYYDRLDQKLMELNKQLFIFWYKMDCRLKKVKEGKHVIPPERLITRADKQLKKLKEKDPHLFYYPSLIRTSPDIYFSDDFAYEYLSYLLVNDGIERCLSLWRELNIQNIEAVRMAILSIKSLCDPVSKAKDISNTLCEVDRYRINHFFQQVYSLYERAEVDFKITEDRIRRKRPSCIVSRRVAKMTNHEKWPDLVKILKPCKRKLNRAQNSQRIHEIKTLCTEIINSTLKKPASKDTMSLYKNKLLQLAREETKSNSNSIDKKS